jgi:hypothetical protein
MAGINAVVYFSSTVFRWAHLTSPFGAHPLESLSQG